MKTPALILAAAAYAAIGIVFAALPADAHHVRVWRLAAWLASAVVAAAHILYEQYRLRSSPRATALHAAGAVALGAFGLDADLMWERWPYQRIGARAYMRSTYDRAGGNEGADASHFLYQLADDFNVTLDVAGQGVLYFARYNHWHGSPWHYVVDGTDHLVQESSSADPTHPVPGSVFLPEQLFPRPLTWTWDATLGADLMWVPIPFEREFRMAYSRTRYGTGYYIYHLFVPGANLSRPLRAWDGKTPPDGRVLALLDRAGTDLVSRPESEEGRAKGVRQEDGIVSVPPQGAVTLLKLTRAPAMLRALELSVPKDSAVAFSGVRLRVTWDERPSPSIDAPVALFCGTGTFYNRDEREYLVKGFPMHVRYVADRLP